MIPVYKNTVIYICCPPNYASGGPELLHQLAYKLTLHGFNACIYYSPDDHPEPLHQRYIGYKTKYVRDVVCNKLNLLIIPEVYVDFFWNKHFSKIRKVIWWLSIDNYFFYLNKLVSQLELEKDTFSQIKKAFGLFRFPDLIFLKKARLLHLVQSEYARRFLQANFIKVEGFLSDYLNKEFLDYPVSNVGRQNIVLYNPLKGNDFTSKLIAKAPHLQWCALENMHPAQVAALLSRAKVYIDFGHHPGKDRLPREAAIMGCCIITGLKGAAKFKEDIPIPEAFKFDEITVDISVIIKKVECCLNDFENQTKHFSHYRNVIRSEEGKFDEDLKKIFIRR